MAGWLVNCEFERNIQCLFLGKIATGGVLPEVRAKHAPPQIRTSLDCSWMLDEFASNCVLWGYYIISSCTWTVLSCCCVAAPEGGMGILKWLRSALNWARECCGLRLLNDLLGSQKWMVQKSRSWDGRTKNSCSILYTGCQKRTDKYSGRSKYRSF
jgi:hypothetical protein